jgi:hypothetical protein
MTFGREAEKLAAHLMGLGEIRNQKISHQQLEASPS